MPGGVPGVAQEEPLGWAMGCSPCAGRGGASHRMVTQDEHEPMHSHTEHHRAEHNQVDGRLRMCVFVADWSTGEFRCARVGACASVRLGVCRPVRVTGILVSGRSRAP